MAEEFGSSEAGKKGGAARAKSLSKEARSEVARRAAEARWMKEGKQPLPKATHEGTLDIGGVEIACAVLDGKRRVITQSGFMIALGRARQAKGRQYYDSDVNLPAFLTAKNLKSFISPELEVTSSQVEFLTISGRRAFGYSAELLPKVCDVFLDAKIAHEAALKGRPPKKVLSHTQVHIAERALILMRGLAHVGIIALVDEATGFQYDRPRKDLEEYLKKFLSESLRRWVRTFPADYFKHLCRLRGVTLRTDMRLPKYFGILTNNLVWKRIAPGLLTKLKERRQEVGRPNEKLHSGLSLDVGVPELLLHLGMVVGLMKSHTDYAAFEKQLDKIAPIYPKHPGLFDDPNDWKVPE
jgi:hypothetical protein